MEPAELSAKIDAIGFGPYQIWYLLFGGWLTFGEGVELAVGSTLNLSFFREFEMDDPLIRGLLASVVFMGIGIGMFSSGLAGDHWGRRPVILSSYAGMSLTMFGTAFCNGMIQLLLLRFSNGVACGLGVIAAATAMSEVCPSHSRAWLMGLIPFGMATGCLVGAFILWCFMPELHPNGNWRVVCVCASIPAAAQLVVAWFLLDETPYFLAAKDDMQAVVRTLRRMAQQNKVPCAEIEHGAEQDVHVEKIQELIKKRKSKTSLMVLCGGRLKVTMLCLCMLEFLCSFLNTSIGYMLPRLAAHLGGHLLGMQPPAKLLAFATCVDYPSIFVLVALMASPFGHRQIIGCFAVVLGCCFMTLVFVGLDAKVALLAVLIMKLSAFPALAPYHVLKNESLPTAVRMTACGLCSLFGKSGAILAPALFEYFCSSEVRRHPEHTGHHHGHYPGGHGGRHIHRMEHGSKEQHFTIVQFLTNGELAGSGPSVSATSSHVPPEFLFVAGLFCFIIALVIIPLKETKGQPLPEISTLDDELVFFVATSTSVDEEVRPMLASPKSRPGYGSAAGRNQPLID